MVSKGRGPGAALDSYAAEETLQSPNRGSGVVWGTAKKVLSCWLPEKQDLPWDLPVFGE